MIPGSGRSAGEGIGDSLQYSWAPLVAQLVKNLPLMRVEGLGRSPGEGKGYPLERILLRIPCIARRSNQSVLNGINSIFIARTDTEAEAPIFGHLVHRSQLIIKTSDAGKD